MENNNITAIFDIKKQIDVKKKEQRLHNAINYAMDYISWLVGIHDFEAVHKKCKELQTKGVPVDEAISRVILDWTAERNIINSDKISLGIERACLINNPEASVKMVKLRAGVRVKSVILYFLVLIAFISVLILAMSNVKTPNDLGWFIAYFIIHIIVSTWIWYMIKAYSTKYEYIDDLQGKWFV